MMVARTKLLITHPGGVAVSAGVVVGVVVVVVVVVLWLLTKGRKTF